MRLSLGIDQRQQLVQKLAPRMIQSMEILQLPLMALQERIDQELTENPLLELQESDPDNPEEPYERENPDAPDVQEKELVIDAGQDNKDDFERLLNLDQDVPDYFDESPRRSANRLDEEADRKHDAIANIESRPVTLQDHLLHQLGEMDVEPRVMRLCERIASTLNAADGGYFRGNLEDLLPANESDPESLRLAQEALDLLQSLDPLGVCARDLRECLLLQLTPDMPYYEEARTLVAGHLEDLQYNRLPQIQRITGYSVETIQHALGTIRRLNPKPAATFIDIHVPTVTPDVVVERASDGTYKVVVEEQGTPPLRISEYYRRRLAEGTATAEEREFIKRKINAAQWLIESIEQRRSTLTKVSQAIVDHQTRFLDEGPEHIEPLKMQQIAEKVGVHVTTVSRAVDDKWIQTPRGILPLKRFFVGGTRNEEGEDVAWDVVRIKLQEVIDAEDKHKPLSDEDLVEALKQHGLNVARRTITKYREKMQIPSSRQRRVWSE